MPPSHPRITANISAKSQASGTDAFPSLASSKSIKTLLKLAKAADKEHKSLLLLLILLNAHPKLSGHAQIFENLLVIAETPPVTDYLARHPEASELIEKWKALCHWMVTDRTLRSDYQELNTFDWQPPPGSGHASHPMNRNLCGFTRNSVCSCLYNRHESINDHAQIPGVDTAAYAYLCLQAQMLVSYMHARMGTGQYSKMARHTEKDECPVSPINPYNACVAIRHLNRTKYTDLVLDLGAHLELERFRIILSTIEVPASITQGLTSKEARIETAQAKLYVTYLDNYFRAFSETVLGKRKKRRIRGTRSTRRPRFSGTRTGFIHAGNGVWLDIPELKDEDNDFRYSPIQNVYISNSNDDQDGRKAEASGLAPDEIIVEAFRIYHPDEIGGAMMQTKYAEMAKMMAAQRFAWDYEVLTATELRCLWRLINKIINDASLQQGAWNYQTSNRVQYAIIIKMMLLLGQNLETVRNIYPSRLRSKRGDGLYCMPPSGNDSGYWELPSVGPLYRTTLDPATINLGRNKCEWLRLPDLTGISVDIQIYLAKTGRTLDRIFAVESKTAKEGVEAILNELKETWKLPSRKGKKSQVDASEQSTQRITLSKIRNVLGTRLRYISRDATVEWITLASSERKGETRMHYTHLPDQKIISSYASAVRSLLKDIGEPHKSAAVNVAGNGKFHGARFVASKSSVKQLVTDASANLTHRPKFDDPSSVIHYHNVYTFYVWLMQSMFTSYRSVNSPDELMNGLSPTFISDFSGVSDKENPKLADKARLVHIPGLLKDQLYNFDRHLSKIERKFNIPSYGSHFTRYADRHFFFLDPHGNPKPVTCSWCEKMMAEFNVPLPGNFHRAFLRTELIERGCDGQTADAFLGHFKTGESPFFRFSSLDYQIWQSQLEPMLIDLMKELGFSYYPSLVVAKRT